MADVLNSLSNELADLVKAADPSIVRVEARRRLPASGIVWSEDGLIVTANHVVESEDKIGIGLPNGETAEAKLVGRDPSTDIALLRAADVKLTAPAWGAYEDLNVGHLVLALGRPGETVLATMGVVSSLESGWHALGWRPPGRRGPFGGRGRRHGRHQQESNSGTLLENFLQTDVLMYPGFSGGALVGADGKVLGMNTSALIRGISLTLAVPTLERVIEALSKHGRIQRGYLGIGVQSVNLPANIAEEIDQEVGVLIVTVEPGSPAESSGLMLGDALVTLDGDPVTDVEELLVLLTGERVGKNVVLQIVRAGELIEKQVTVGERPKSE
ncbi:MAG TPA: trypsin-like peptidase domain-containing protein [Aggregatilineales bacterium]|nr:trypsin-like peptidase domain-containing protein [Aggregatilineales bacterium]